MLDRHNKIHTLLFYLLITIEILIVIFLALRQHPNISFKNESSISLNKGWTYIDDSGRKHLINLPAKLDAGADHTVIISRKLPAGSHNLNNLGILLDHQDIYAYLDHTIIFAKENSSHHSILNTPPARMFVMIPLPPQSEGRYLTIKIISRYSDCAGKINEINAGTQSTLIMNYIDAYGINLIIALIILINGAMAIFAYLFLKRLLTINRSIFYLGWFTILVSLWMIMESNLTQLFMSNEYVISALSYLALITFPIPILQYICLFQNYHFRKIAYYITYIFEGSALLQLLLQFLNLMDFHESLFITKAEIVLLLGFIVLSLIYDLLYYKNNEIRIFTVSAVILFVFGVIELSTYKIQLGNNIVAFFQLGFLIFSIIMIWDALKKFANAIQLNESAKHYKFLATRDLLTNCRNRIAYAKDIEHIPLDRKITIFLSDMNNMKAINDTYGHQAGDEAIALCGQCLLKVFGRRVYRIGGDEFVCIAYNLGQKKTDTLLNNLQNECMLANEGLPYDIHMSVGYAVYDKAIDKTIHDTIKRADINMYENKNKMKQ